MLPVRSRTSVPRRHAACIKAPRSRVAPFRCRLIIMAKAPVAGRVKTRLAAEAGLAVALRFTRHSLVALGQRVGLDARWSASLAVTPDTAARSRIWPRCMPTTPQGGGDLGARMQRLCDRALPGPLVIIGTDIPDIEPAHIAAAFRLLGRHDAVLGPAQDGGYWLIGMRRRPRILRPFGGVRWSSAQALGDTLANLRGRSVAMVATLRDVDTFADLMRCSERRERRIRYPTSEI
jgi:rSAM/selenodomain-associated transferase 1